MQNKTLKL